MVDGQDDVSWNGDYDNVCRTRLDLEEALLILFRQ